MAEVTDEAVRQAWRNLAPPEHWRGRQTGWSATDLWALSGVLHELQPALVIVAGNLCNGGLPLYVADLLDANHRGKVLAAAPMSREMQRAMPEHRRIQWVNADLTGEVAGTVSRMAAAANPVVVLSDDAHPEGVLATAVTMGSYLVTAEVAAGEAPFEWDNPARDPMGLSNRAWLRRVPR